jgi:hypothetical protein
MTRHFANLVHPMMSRRVQSVFAPASWHAGQRIALTSGSARRAAAAVDCIVRPDEVAPFKPSPGALGVAEDSCSVAPGVL